MSLPQQLIANGWNLCFLISIGVLRILELQAATSIKGSLHLEFGVWRRSGALRKDPILRYMIRSSNSPIDSDLSSLQVAKDRCMRNVQVLSHQNCLWLYTWEFGEGFGLVGKQLNFCLRRCVFSTDSIKIRWIIKSKVKRHVCICA